MKISAGVDVFQSDVNPFKIKLQWILRIKGGSMSGRSKVTKTVHVCLIHRPNSRWDLVALICSDFDINSTQAHGVNTGTNMYPYLWSPLPSLTLSLSLQAEGVLLHYQAENHSKPENRSQCDPENWTQTSNCILSSKAVMHSWQTVQRHTNGKVTIITISMRCPLTQWRQMLIIAVVYKDTLPPSHINGVIVYSTAAHLLSA